MAPLSARCPPAVRPLLWHAGLILTGRVLGTVISLHSLPKMTGDLKYYLGIQIRLSTAEMGEVCELQVRRGGPRMRRGRKRAHRTHSPLPSTPKPDEST